jgi:hypothetical protein
MPTSVAKRAKEIHDEIMSRLDITDAQMNDLTSIMKIGHQTGSWEAGKPAPLGEDITDWLVVALFDHSPQEYDVNDQGDAWTFGETRAYTLCPADVFGPLRDKIIAHAGDSPGAEMSCVMFRLFSNGMPVRKAMTEATFVDELTSEFEVLKNLSGIGADEDEDDTWECLSCHTENPVDLGDADEDDEDSEATQVLFCGKCGAGRTEVVQQ